ncbi:hypothetical protein Javan174_0030 [Streptococcus phage Javan174]|nr:hypothetical protein Javan174_0030 [Streptococcus phage Javan174]
MVLVVGIITSLGDTGIGSNFIHLCLAMVTVQSLCLLAYVDNKRQGEG